MREAMARQCVALDDHSLHAIAKMTTMAGRSQASPIAVEKK